VLAVAAGAAVVGAWYAFRPDRLFTTRVVDEPAPAAVVAPTAEGAAPSARPERSRAASGSGLASDPDTVGVVPALAVGRGRAATRTTTSPRRSISPAIAR
jgi:hypothetical protein